MVHEERLRSALADRYRIEREIGSGGMATVYLAEDLKHNRKVAVKVLNPELAQTLGAERFLREIETAANLTHPHILPLFDSGEADGFLFYVMPYVKGESLRARLTKEKQLPVEDAVQITREIADALAYAHREGVIHRDVKPANIMLEAGHAVLADFGIAQAVAEAKDQRLTRTGTSLGTPAYMSPEQASGEQDVDGRSDQYALGCVFYEMLAGHPPFTGAQVEAVIRQYLMEEPPLVTRVRPSVTAEVVKVINRALSKSPADRFRTTGEMAAALAVTTTPVKASARRFSIIGSIVAGVAGVVIIGAGAYLVSRSDADPSPDTAPVVDVEGDRPSVAVLPFENFSPNPDNAYFADGMQEEITSKLSIISGLSVKGRSSVMQYREDRPPIPQIAEELNVDFVLEGSARLAADQVRLTMQLIDARRDVHLWPASYDLDLSVENLLEVQIQVAREVAYRVGVGLTPQDEDAVARVLTDNTDAYMFFVQGKQAYLWERQGGEVEDDYSSISLFDQAVHLDPNFAPARAYLALSLTYTNPDEQRQQRAREEAELALEVQPGLGEARVALGRYHILAGEGQEALRQFQAAEEVSPNLAIAILELGLLQQQFGQFETGLRTLQRVENLDPRDPSVQRSLVRSYIFLHRYDDAIRAIEAREAASPAYGYFHDRAWIYLLRGEPEKARVVVDQLLSRHAGVFYNMEPTLPLGVVRRWLTPEDRRTSRQDYLVNWTREAPCQTERERCMVRAAQEEELGSREKAQVLWDSLRVGYEGSPPQDWFEQARVVLTYQRLGEKEAAMTAAEALVDRNGARSEDGIMDGFYLGPSSRLLLAGVLAHFEEHDRAIDILEEELPAPSWLSVPILEIDPIWAPLRDHPRFQALLDYVEH